MQRQLDRVSGDCGFRKLGDLDGGKLTKWLLQREAEEMSTATRNGYRETMVMFANWCCSGTRPRLSGNPFAEVPKANVRTDRRRQRRAMTEAELVKLLEVARLRPLAEFGREAVRPTNERDEATGTRRKRSNWCKAALTLDTMQVTVERARGRLAKNPELIDELERLGRERALIYKTLVLTGLRKGELASLTVGQLDLDGPMPFVVLDAADEKNRQVMKTRLNRRSKEVYCKNSNGVRNRVDFTAGSRVNPDGVLVRGTTDGTDPLTVER